VIRWYSPLTKMRTDAGPVGAPPKRKDFVCSVHGPDRLRATRSAPRSPKRLRLCRWWREKIGRSIYRIDIYRIDTNRRASHSNRISSLSACDLSSPEAHSYVLKCLLHPANTRPLTCAGCLTGVQSRLAERAVQYEMRIAAFRHSESQRKRRKGMRQEREDQAHKSEQLMDQTTWGEWNKRHKTSIPRRQTDPLARSIRLANQAESMRKLREYRRKSSDLWAVYWSEVRPRHFRNSIPPRFWDIGSTARVCITRAFPLAPLPFVASNS
jgi:hypothetical protein